MSVPIWRYALITNPGMTAGVAALLGTVSPLYGGEDYTRGLYRITPRNTPRDGNVDSPYDYEAILIRAGGYLPLISTQNPTPIAAWGPSAVADNGDIYSAFVGKTSGMSRFTSSIWKFTPPDYVPINVVPSLFLQEYGWPVSPRALTFNRVTGNIYGAISDFSGVGPTWTRIFELNTNTNVISIIAGSTIGDVDSPNGLAAKFPETYALLSAADGALYVACGTKVKRLKYNGGTGKWEVVTVVVANPSITDPAIKALCLDWETQELYMFSAFSKIAKTSVLPGSSYGLVLYDSSPLTLGATGNFILDKTPITGGTSYGFIGRGIRYWKGVLLPKAVHLNEATFVTSSSAKLTWAMTTTTASSFATYKLFRSLTPGITPDNSVPVIFTGPVLITTLTNMSRGLSASTRYYYRVFVYDTGGEYAGSNEVEVMTVNEAPAWDSSDTFVVTQNIGDRIHSLDLDWTNVGALAISDFSHWEIQYKPDGGPAWLPVGTYTDRYQVSLTKTGLTSNTLYHFQIRIVDQGGLGSTWKEADGTTEAEDLWPTGVTLRASVVSQRVLRCNWTQADPSAWPDPTEAFGSYKLFYTKAMLIALPLPIPPSTGPSNPDMSAYKVGPVVSLVDTLQADISGLQPDTDYYFALLVCDDPSWGLPLPLEKQCPALADGGDPSFYNITWVTATTLALVEPDSPAELQIHYATITQLGAFPTRVLEVVPGDRIYLTGTVLDEGTWDVFPLRDISPFETGTPDPFDPSLFSYLGDSYVLSEGYYEGTHVGAHDGVPLEIVEVHPWISQTMEYSKPFVPLETEPCDYPLGAGYDPAVAVINSTKVSLIVPDILSTTMDPVNYIMIRAKRNRVAGQEDLDYDFIILRYNTVDIELSSLTSIRCMPPPESFNELTDNPDRMQLADTSPKPGLADPASIPVWPRFSLSEGIGRGTLQWFCSYIKPGALKYLTFEITVGDNDIYMGDPSKPDDIEEPGIRYRIGESDWDMTNMVFQPEFSQTGVVPGNWPSVLYDVTLRAGVEGGSGTILTVALKIEGSNLAEQQIIEFAVTDIDGEVSIIPVILNYRAGTFELVYLDPGLNAMIVIDPITGEQRMVTRARVPIDAQIKTRWVPD